MGCQENENRVLSSLYALGWILAVGRVEGGGGKSKMHVWHDACETMYLLLSLKTGTNASKLVKDDELFWDYYPVISASKHMGIVTLSLLLLLILHITALEMLLVNYWGVYVGGRHLWKTIGCSLFSAKNSCSTEQGKRCPPSGFRVSDKSVRGTKALTSPSWWVRGRQGSVARESNRLHQNVIDPPWIKSSFET